MNSIPLWALFTALAVLLAFSAFFSGSETALMTLNRYRLRHRANEGHGGAKRAQKLLDQPERLIGLILLGNNFVNVLAAQLVTLIALRFQIPGAIAIAGGIFTLVVLIFSEVLPKTIAATKPEKIAYFASYIYAPLLKILYPIVWAVNKLVAGILKLIPLDTNTADSDVLSREELKTVVNEAGALLPKKRRNMLISVLDLEDVQVEDIMVPRSDIIGVDLNDSWTEISRQLRSSQHTRLPVFRDSIDDVVGFIHARKAFQALMDGNLDTPESLAHLARPPYFIPEGTPLNRQLVNFQNERRRVGLVVDEYGDIHGLVALDDILEEIVGEFTTDPAMRVRGITADDKGGYVIKANFNIRHLNRIMGWQLPTDGARTLNGLIIEYLETIPSGGISLKLNDYPIEILQTRGNSIRTVRIAPKRTTKSRRPEL